MSTRATSRYKAPLGPSVFTSLDRARASLTEAMLADSAADRYVAAHVAALRIAAAVLASRARPAGRRRPTSAWTLLARVAPELSEWAAFFAAGADKRAALEAGLGRVTDREADDLLRDAERFLVVVEQLLDVPHRPVLPQGSGVVDQPRLDRPVDRRRRPLRIPRRRDDRALPRRSEGLPPLERPDPGAQAGSDV